MTHEQGKVIKVVFEIWQGDAFVSHGLKLKHLAIEEHINMIKVYHLVCLSKMKKKALLKEGLFMFFWSLVIC